MRSINSDALGKMGEQRFGALCAAAGLICNKSDWDRTGWDFFVEFPFKPLTYQQPLDRRPQPPACIFQVKSVWSGGKTFKIRLSSAERLAKFVLPAAIIVIEFNNSSDIIYIHVLHIIDDILSTILNETRKCHATDSTKINKKYIRLNYVELGTRIDLDPPSLKDFLQTICGEDPVAYTRKKADQIENLGVIGNRFSGRFTIKARDQGELADILLGLRKGEIEEFSTTETRFGITLPVHKNSGPAEILIQPNPRQGEIIFRNLVTKEVVRIGVGIVAPSLVLRRDNNLVRIRLFNEFIEIFIQRHDGSFTISSKTEGASKLLLSQHVILNKVQRIVTGGAGTMELRTQGKRLMISNFDANAPSKDVKHFDFAGKIFRYIRKIADAAGGGDIRLSTNDINIQMGLIEFVYHLITEPPATISLGSLSVEPTEQFPDNIEKAETLVIGRIAFDNLAIAFCAIATITISTDKNLKILDVGELNVRQIDVIDLSVLAFDQFQTDMQEETGLQMVLKLGDPAAENAPSGEPLQLLAT